MKICDECKICISIVVLINVLRLTRFGLLNLTISLNRETPQRFATTPRFPKRSPISILSTRLHDIAVRFHSAYLNTSRIPDIYLYTVTQWSRRCSCYYKWLHIQGEHDRALWSGHAWCRNLYAAIYSSFGPWCDEWSGGPNEVIAGFARMILDVYRVVRGRCVHVCCMYNSFSCLFEGNRLT